MMYVAGMNTDFALSMAKYRSSSGRMDSHSFVAEPNFNKPRQLSVAMEFSQMVQFSITTLSKHIT